MLLSRAGRLPTGPGADARGISEDYAIIKDQRVGDPARLSPTPPSQLVSSATLSRVARVSSVEFNCSHRAASSATMPLST
jgi:hypothetical protein